MIDDRTPARWWAARELVTETRTAEDAALADVLATLDDRTAVLFARLQRMRNKGDAAQHELIAAGAALSERLRPMSTDGPSAASDDPRGRTPSPSPCRTGEGSASDSAHASRGFSRGAW